MKIYVAGHRGLVGSAIVRAIESEGKDSWVGASRQELDLFDRHRVFDFVRAEKPDAVVIAAARVGGIAANNNFPVEFLAENLQIEMSLLEACHAADIEKVLFLGSSCIYPRLAPQPIKEEYLLTGELEPTNEAYANLKIEMENVLIESGLSHVILRIANAYGPGQLTGRGQGVLAEWISSLKNGDKPKLFGSMEVVRDFVHIDDVVKALWLAGQVKDFSGIINIGSGKPVSLRDCLSLLSQISDQDIEITTVESRPVDRARVYLSIDRAASVLNWSPEISLEQGLVAWWNDWEQ